MFFLIFPHLSIMKLQSGELPTAKVTPNNTQKRVLLLVITLLLLTLIQLHLHVLSGPPSPPRKLSLGSSNDVPEEDCDLFSGKWVENPRGPYYTNRTCDLMIDEQNCMKFGRKDEDFMKWRWKPDGCDLPFFDGVEFLELVRGKSLAFVGDSVARNQMQSLLCLLSSVAYPEYKSHRYFYPKYKFKMGLLWAPYLVKYEDSGIDGYSIRLMNLHLDQADKPWTAEVGKFDYVIVSAGNWFFRPLMIYENSQLVGCHLCHEPNVTQLDTYYAYRRAFRTTFKTFNRLRNYKGVTFLRTFSVGQFENGSWDKGGSCGRTSPYTREELKVEWFIEQMLLSQMEEFEEAEKKGLEKGLIFKVLNTTVPMLMRPDGHPNHYGRKNERVADCVHWCLPGPIDTWNELLLSILRREGRTQINVCSRFNLFC